MGRLHDWWRRLTGAAGPATAPPRPPAHPAHPAPNPTPGELELADDAPPPKPSRLAEAGFDPYSSDAGYSKPHSWERVDHD